MPISIRTSFFQQLQLGMMSIVQMSVLVLVTLVLGITNVVLAILAAGPLGWGLYGVAAAGALTLTAKNLIFSPVYTAHILRIHWWSFYRGLGTVVIAAAGLFTVAHATSSSFSVTSWPRLITACLVISGVYCALVGFLVVTPQEKSLLISAFSARRKGAS